MSPIDGLPSVPDTALPAAVRSGSAADQRAFRSALGFEQVMLGQLVEAIVPQDSALADSPYAGAVKDSFAQGLVDSGGIGLAKQLFETMQRTSA
jgi:Rod binding domain-containing protein